MRRSHHITQNITFRQVLIDFHDDKGYAYKAQSYDFIHRIEKNLDIIQPPNSKGQSGHPWWQKSASNLVLSYREATVFTTEPPGHRTFQSLYFTKGLSILESRHMFTIHPRYLSIRLVLRH